MAGKKPSTPKEIPLHDIVLKIMFEANKEKPAKLTGADVYWKITDASVNEITISDVLKWLVAQKRVEEQSGKYSLDRFEFLEQRNLDQGVNLSENKGEKPPLHEVVLQLMFEASKEKPIEFTFDDIFWKISDPSVRESQLGDVLKWLAHHHRVEYRLGKYSLDRIEFLDQKKVEEVKMAKVVVKKKAMKPKKESTPPVKKVAAKKPPKIVVPAAPEEVTLVKKPSVPKKKVIKSPPKKEPIEKTVVAEKVTVVKEAPSEPKISKKEEVIQVVETKPIIEPEDKSNKTKVKQFLLPIIAICFLHTVYVLSTLGEMSSVVDLKNIILKLFVVNSLVILIFTFLLYRRD